ncbi:hypothetical protein F4805DRAFT_437039 [Annulohypoxylon moriforme]|nr:hypothetical protein F4805DRAFT_437039 [Annulohypoxylon moriforme]
MPFFRIPRRSHNATLQCRSYQLAMKKDDSLILESPPPEGEKQPFIGRVFRSASTQCTAAFQEAVSDLKSIRRERAVLWSLLGIWITAVLGVFISLTAYAFSSTEFRYGETTACRSDNSFNVNISAYNAWEASGFFEINLGAGNLTFTQAKVIDITWDIIIGRGGQVLLASIPWRVFADYVATSMEFKPITYAVFSSIYVRTEPSILSTFRMTQTFIHGRGLKSKLAMVFVTLDILFLVAWPTFSGAMTGYTPTVKAFVPDYNGNYIPFSDFRPIAYIIHDGPRINLTDDYAVSSRFEDDVSLEEPIILRNGRFDGLCGPFNFDADECDLQRTTSNYVSLYGFFGLWNTTSVWLNEELPSPILNISAFYFDPDSEFYGSNWTDHQGAGVEYPFRDPSNITLAYSNQTYLLTYVQANGRCQPVQDRFKWGFSFLQLLAVVILLNIWTIGTYVMWFKARFQLPLQGQPEIPRGWKSVLILAEKMNEEFQQAGINVQSLTNKRLEEEIGKILGGGSVSFDSPLTKKGYSFWDGTKKWFSEKRSRCLVMVLTFVLISGVWVGLLLQEDSLDSLFVMPPCIFFGMFFALGVGSTIRSSLFMALCWNLPAFIICLILSRTTSVLEY